MPGVDEVTDRGAVLDDSAAGAEEVVASASDDAGAPGAPPDADAVAARALAVAALLQRSLHEGKPGRASEVRQLQSWVDAFGLYASFGAGAFELFEQEHGAWSPEDRTAVAWLAEELRVLSWALGLEAALPATFERSDAKALLRALPLLEPPRDFLARATVRDPDELELVRAYYEVVEEAANAEVWARAVTESPALLDAPDEGLGALLEAIASAGLDSREQGVAARLRAWSRELVQALFEVGSPHAQLAFDAGAFEAMDAKRLGTALALAHTRAGALEWLTEGDEWELEAAEEAAQGE